MTPRSSGAARRGVGPRAAAAQAVAAILRQRRSLALLLPEALESLRDPAERALTQELIYGTLRHHLLLAALLPALLKRGNAGGSRPVSSDARSTGRLAPRLHALLLIGLYQLRSMRIPPHAAVHQSVSAATELGLGRAKGLVNAVLRRFQREGEALTQAATAHDEAARYAHPQWLLERLRAAWPEAWQNIVAANNARPPMTLRVNPLHIAPQAYLRRLERAGIAAHVAPHAPQGVVLERPMAATRLPGFAEGWVSVQDGGAQQAAALLRPAPGERVLDACAAPGGKTAHLLESAPCRVTALDIDAERAARIGAELTRLRLRDRAEGGEVAVAVGDAAGRDWWDGRPFDHILLDAPCTASGTIRRHPDIKLLRRPEDETTLAARQCALLDNLWGLLRPGGRLLYATCSLLPEENHRQIERFLAAHPDAVERPIDAPWGRALGVGRQILPGEGEMDGFYYALVEKRPVACG